MAYALSVNNDGTCTVSAEGYVTEGLTFRKGEKKLVSCRVLTAMKHVALKYIKLKGLEIGDTANDCVEFELRYSLADEADKKVHFIFTEVSEMFKVDLPVPFDMFYASRNGADTELDNYINRVMALYPSVEKDVLKSYNLSSFVSLVSFYVYGTIFSNHGIDDLSSIVFLMNLKSKGVYHYGVCSYSDDVWNPSESKKVEGCLTGVYAYI